MYPTTAQDHIEKFIRDGDTKEQAIARLEGILHGKTPQEIIERHETYWDRIYLERRLGK